MSVAIWVERFLCEEPGLRGMFLDARLTLRSRCSPTRLSREAFSEALIKVLISAYTVKRDRIFRNLIACCLSFKLTSDEEYSLIIEAILLSKRLRKISPRSERRLCKRNPEIH